MRLFSCPACSRCLTWLIVAGAIVVAGCAADDDRIATFPVSGQVLYNGSPATGAKVIFFFTSESLRGMRIPTPQATVDERGNFNISCFDHEDGAPAGEYGIAIVWRDDSATTHGDEKPPDRLEGRYANPQRSGLSATIVEGKNRLPPIHLK